MRRRSSIKWILLGAFTLSAIAGPFVINESYKTGTGYVTLWGAAEMLSYLGMLLAAAGTVIGVFLSIQHAQKQYQEDKRQRVLPFFAINRLKQEKVDTFVQGLYYGLMQKNPPSKQTPLEEIKGLRYKEYPVNEGFFFIKGEKIEFSTEIDEELKQKAEKETNPVLDGMLPHFDDLNPIYIPIRLKNVGNGCAICMQISVEKGEAVASSPSVSISVDETFHVWIYADKKDILADDYQISVSYQDIYGNLYMQNGLLTFSRHQEIIQEQLAFDTNEHQKLVRRA